MWHRLLTRTNVAGRKRYRVIWSQDRYVSITTAIPIYFSALYPVQDTTVIPSRIILSGTGYRFGYDVNNNKYMIRGVIIDVA